MNGHRNWAGFVLVLLVLGGCVANQQTVMLSKKGAVELRAIQTRQFETGNLMKVYRAVIATYQDLGYSITKVEPAVGMVSAEKLAQLKMTASVFKRGEKRVMVRSNAIVKVNLQVATGHQVDSPEFYQKRFFEPLSKALFLTALQVEDPPDAAEKAAMEAAKEIEKAAAEAAKAAEDAKAAKTARDKDAEASKTEGE